MKHYVSLVLIFLFFVTVIIIGMIYLQYGKSQKSEKVVKGSSSAVVEEDTKDLIGKVSKLIAVPENEEPTVATVTDIEKLKAQPFFTKAQNGDKVLIYNQAKKAILYRPSENKIIEVSKINIGETPSQEPTR